MKRSFIFILLYIFFIQYAYTQEKAENIYTTLVIIEEQQNGEMSKESLVSDGIFDALWDLNENIFFDMVKEKPFLLIDNQLDVKPFLQEAKKSGADTLLLIKFNYTLTEEGAGFRIKADKVKYNLYSLKQLKSLKNGDKEILYNELIDKKDKEKILKDIGYKMLNEIFK
ncbi:MAG: hypothetical protein JXB50_14255 [Spirochaetes bacterium]|nr:hypothetical protein [Spirochaetota bacterium]